MVESGPLFTRSGQGEGALASGCTAAGTVRCPVPSKRAQLSELQPMADEKFAVRISPIPDCGTSRTTLALIRDAGIEPVIVEYLKTPPDRATLRELISRMGIRPRDLLRQKEALYAELGLDAEHWTD